MKGPEKAIESVVRAVGVQSARLALSALPRALHPPVELAIRAVDKVMDLGLGLRAPALITAIEISELSHYLGMRTAT